MGPLFDACFPVPTCLKAKLSHVCRNLEFTYERVQYVYALIGMVVHVSTIYLSMGELRVPQLKTGHWRGEVWTDRL